MFRPALLPVVLLLAAPAFADVANTCRMTDDQTDCTRVLACIGDAGRWFNGRSIGRGAGTVSGSISDGVTCSGTWTEHGPLGFGQAQVACSDGMTASVIYYYQDAYTGTALGRGQTNRGEVVKIWSGTNVLQYLKDGSDAPDVRLPCGDGSILIS